MTDYILTRNSTLKVSRISHCSNDVTPNTAGEQTYSFTSHHVKQALFPPHKVHIIYYEYKNSLVSYTIRVLCAIPREISQFPEKIEKVGFLVKI